MGSSEKSSTLSSKALAGHGTPANGASAKPEVSFAVTFTHTAAPEKAEKGLSVGDMANVGSATAGAVAAFLALLTIRQAQKSAASNRLRDSQLATLNLLTSGQESLGHLTLPIEQAIEHRAAEIATFLVSRGATGPKEDIEAAVISGSLFDIAVPFTRDILHKFGDWYGSIPEAERAAFATFLNTLEETSTSVLRGTLNLDVLDKAYGTLLRSTYQEVSQAIYAHRRASSYRQLDQLERVMELLYASAEALFRPPGRLRRLRWLFGTRHRQLSRLLAPYSEQSVLDGGQLEGALIGSGLLYRETEIRAQLMVTSRRIVFDKTRDPWFAALRGKPLNRARHRIVMRRRGDSEALLAEILDLPLDATTSVPTGAATVSLEPLLQRVPHKLFRPEHLNTRDSIGGFSGPKSIYCLQIVVPLPSAADVRKIVRVAKRELNDGRLRPFVVPISGSPAEMGPLQTVLHGEGGVLLFADVTATSIQAIWLF